jgi:hypothetical protein
MLKYGDIDIITINRYVSNCILKLYFAGFFIYNQLKP